MAQPKDPEAERALPTAGAPASGRELYERLVREHSGELYRVAFRLTGLAAAAEDVLQEAFVEAWKSLPSLRDGGAARAWLYAILRRRYFRWAKRQGRREVSIPDEALEGRLADPAPAVLDRLGDRDALQRALDGLPDPQREALVLVYVEGLAIHEAAARLDVPRGTVLSRIHRARQRLRVALRRGEGGER